MFTFVTEYDRLVGKMIIRHNLFVHSYADVNMTIARRECQFWQRDTIEDE